MLRSKSENALRCLETSKVSLIPRQTGSLCGVPEMPPVSVTRINLPPSWWREKEGLRAPDYTGQTPKLKEREIKLFRKAGCICFTLSETHRRWSPPRSLTRRLITSPAQLYKSSNLGTFWFQLSFSVSYLHMNFLVSCFVCPSTRARQSISLVDV